MLGSAAIEAFETFLHDYPRACTTQERMVCIDQLIHSFHISLQVSKPNRSFAKNLIEGSHDQVIQLLDRLFAKPDGVDKEQWRATVDKMYVRRRGRE